MESLPPNKTQTIAELQSKFETHSEASRASIAKIDIKAFREFKSCNKPSEKIKLFFQVVFLIL